jgi:hypothetical protein
MAVDAAETWGANGIIDRINGYVTTGVGGRPDSAEYNGE